MARHSAGLRWPVQFLIVMSLSQRRIAAFGAEKTDPLIRHGSCCLGGFVMGEDYLTAAEVAAMFHCHPETAMRMARSGQLPMLRPNARLIVS
jgi:hypothetical protein